MINCELKDIDFMLKLVCTDVYRRYFYPYRKICAIIYKDCIDFIFSSANNIYHCISNNFIYDEYLDLFIDESDSKRYTLYNSNNKITICDQKQYTYSELLVVNNKYDIEIDEDYIIRRIITHGKNECNIKSRYYYSFKKYIMDQLEIPKFKLCVHISCPYIMRNFYKDLIYDNCIKPKLSYYIETFDIYNNIYESIPWLKYVSRLVFNINKYNTIDNKSKYWNICKVEIPLIESTTKNDVSIFYKSLLKYLKYFLVENGIIDKDLFPFLKISNMILTVDKMLIITIVYKNDNMMEVVNNEYEAKK